jgi:hypothetical protein
MLLHPFSILVACLFGVRLLSEEKAALVASLSCLSAQFLLPFAAPTGLALLACWVVSDVGCRTASRLARPSVHISLLAALSSRPFCHAQAAGLLFTGFCSPWSHCGHPSRSSLASPLRGLKKSARLILADLCDEDGRFPVERRSFRTTGA